MSGIASVMQERSLFLRQGCGTRLPILWGATTMELYLSVRTVHQVLLCYVQTNCLNSKIHHYLTIRQCQHELYACPIPLTTESCAYLVLASSVLDKILHLAYIYSATVENLVRFQNWRTLLPNSGTGYPVLEPAAPLENWTNTLVFRVRV